MAAPALKIDNTLGEDTKSYKELKRTIFETHTQEIIIGLCGPIGTDINFVSKSLKQTLENIFNYQCYEIKLSDLIKKYSDGFDFESLKRKPYEYYKNLIDYGNQLREKHVSSILAELAINEIAVNRELNRQADNEEFKSQRVCYIINSLKNKEEMDLFRLIYRDLFYLFGIFSSLENRQKFLEDKGMQVYDVYKLINRDSGEEMQFGQKVSDTFIESDFFLRIDKSTTNSIEPKLKRFLHLIFSSDIVTPSVHETAMYFASAAAGNSACLSRQVGASITDKSGEIISVGWNDVPKTGGNVYQYDEADPTSSNDYRCLNIEGGVCFNDKEKSSIIDDLVNSLIDKGILPTEKKTDALQIVKKSRIKELIEFSRAVHAEMLAIITGSQKAGAKVVDGRLYCTTYPCHNCARHIIASGIKEVYYIEPYRKSLAIKLHRDSITEDEAKLEKVRILMFEGVSPRRYLDFFKMRANSRKESGTKINFPTKLAEPKNTISLQAIPILEKKVTEDLKNRNLINA